MSEEKKKNSAWDTRRSKYGPSGSAQRNGPTPLRRRVEELTADVERLRRRCDELEIERAQLLGVVLAVARRETT